jgi:hypothetical protein
VHRYLEELLGSVKTSTRYLASMVGGFQGLLRKAENDCT